jgi:hypothetical protein
VQQQWQCLCVLEQQLKCDTYSAPPLFGFSLCVLCVQPLCSCILRCICWHPTLLSYVRSPLVQQLAGESMVLQPSVWQLQWFLSCGAELPLELCSRQPVPCCSGLCPASLLCVASCSGLAVATFLGRVATVTFPGITLCSATVAYMVLVCSQQLCMHVVAVTAVPVGLLVTQCQLLHRLCMRHATSVVCDDQNAATPRLQTAGVDAVAAVTQDPGTRL